MSRPPAEPTPPASGHGYHLDIRGTVQGVGFRPWVFRLAAAHGLTGWVRNDAAGVTIEVFGPAESLEAFQRDLTTSPPPAARIDTLDCRLIPARTVDAFTIVASTEADDRQVSIPPDLPTCEACLTELRDPHDRRYRYPFINCTNCGPRFTIAQRVPYDRPHTTMADFRMCATCQAEYDDPLNRRFHAQPNACPDCGPRAWLCDARGALVAAMDPVADAAARLAQGAIVAVKGLGGFHLACDATNDAAVAELRRRKRREEKPLAVMVASLGEAERLAVLGDAERRLLASPERPIVIVEGRPDTALAAGVAPGNPTVGLMLPYTPLHHLLIEGTGRPLVMTSGNLSDEPIAFRNDEALARLGEYVDIFLLHDREIDTRCDDSVARVIAGQPTVFRRSRGFVPRAIRVATAFARPTLACGALLKNTCCLGVGDAAYLGPHTGDLENLETFEAFEHAVGRLCQFVGVTPEVVACDLHPDYLSTRYARRHAAPVIVGVQHHHAHLVSALAEHGVSGPALGVVFDGTGFGTDGTAWGGEFLAGDARHATRVATFRPLPLPGGDVAIRQVWRQALALLLDAFGPEAPVDRLPLLCSVPRHERTVVTQMLEARINSPLARGVGRYFDAVGALGLGRAVARYEGQVALEWNLAADPAERGAYPYATADERGLVQIDLRPAVRALTTDLLGHTPAGVVSARFHNTLAEATTSVVAGLLARLGPTPVVLSGGCFQNARLTEGIVARLGSAVQVIRHHTVPPGDGGLALGQAVVADAQVRSGAPPTAEGLCVSAFPAG